MAAALPALSTKKVLSARENIAMHVHLSSFRPCDLSDLAPSVRLLPDPVAGLHGADPSAHLDKSHNIRIFDAVRIISQPTNGVKKRKQLSAISYQLSAISYQLSAISYQLSAISIFYNF
jgi:hypothetical protein